MGVCWTLNQNLGTTNDVQFNDLVLLGDLTVQGTTVTLNTQELTIEDKLLSKQVVLLHLQKPPMVVVSILVDKFFNYLG